MSLSDPLKIDPEERFPRLARAPIVEAVIHWQARAEAALDREALEAYLRERLPEYPLLRPQHEVRLEHELGPSASAIRRSESWQGFRLFSKDERQVAQFTRNGFVFSRLAPYEGWDSFAEEAKRLYRIHAEIAKPSEIERLGVRFINRIVPFDPDSAADYLTVPPSSPQAFRLPIREFLHQSLFDVPNHPYNLNVVQTVQPAPMPHAEGMALILDIDVFTTKPLDLNENTLDQGLTEMRWLKNKAFFTLVTDKVRERCNRPEP
ncbi:MAG: TIGR04255 family protein [Thermogutta sp.]|nr:TIGR04255 family protein [Thermogutta sp.]